MPIINNFAQKQDKMVVVLFSEARAMSFDAVMNSTYTAKSSVTSFPVETGVNVSDHITNHNEILTMKGIVVAEAHRLSTTVDLKVREDRADPFSIIPLLRDKRSNPQIEIVNRHVGTTPDMPQVPTNLKSELLSTPTTAKSTLLEMRSESDVLTVVAPDGIHTDMIITDVTFPREASHGGPLDSHNASLEVHMTLEHVRFVTSGTASVPKSQEIKDKGKNESGGKKEGNEVTNSSAVSVLNTLPGVDI